MNEVIKKFPKSYVHRLGVMKYEIRRLREKNDPEALVKYVICSALKESPEEAWNDAERKLG